MNSIWLLLTAGFGLAGAETLSPQGAMLQKLGQEADRFERAAHRFQGLEILKQTLPKGTRISKRANGIETLLPEITHEIVSEYGYLPEDVRGGSIKEVRMVLTVNGLKWKRGTKGLEALAKQITAQDEKQKRRSLESWEDFGLRGFISDLAPLILLFARGAASQYEFTYDGIDPAAGLAQYRYQQLDGPEKFTIYASKEPIRQRIQGKIWADPQTQMPLRVSLDATHTDKDMKIRDVSVVYYEPSAFGVLLPAKITHHQYVDEELYVIDEFEYRNFKQIISGRSR